MEASPPPLDSGERTLASRVCRLWRRRPFECFVLAVVALITLFYLEENWRGQRAWAHLKRTLESKGSTLDWSAHIPAPVPDEQNVFKAPMMAEWFAGKTRSEFTRRLGTLYEFSKSRSTNLLAEVTFVSPDTPPAPPAADLVLRYRYSALTLAVPADTNSAAATPTSAIIPIIVMDHAPLTDAIRNLARQINLHYVMDPGVGFIEGEPQPLVCARWENITGEQALVALLSTYNLQLVDDPRTGVVRVVARDPSGPKIRLAGAASEQLTRLVANALAPPSSDFGATSQNGARPPAVLEGAQGITLLSRPLPSVKPLRLLVQSETVPAAKEIVEFFPTNSLAFAGIATARFRVEPAGTNSFQVFLGPPVYYTAAEYLAWSDQFTNEFDLMRQALERPCARIDVDYLQPLSLPSLNFGTVRVVTQTLAQRAQCCLLLEQPEPALRELTLIHDLCRLLEGKPAGQPTTLVAAMINVAVSGLYVESLASGLRLHAWREPQLRALQQQLEHIDLPPVLLAAFRTEQAGVCRTFDTVGPRRILQSGMFTFGPPPEPSVALNLKKASAVLLVLFPRGWVYQNMALAATLQQHCIDGFDPGQQTVSPRKVDLLAGELQQAFNNVSPYNFLAALAVPDFTRGWQALARNQTRAGQAFVVCALERYRLARGEYPPTLDALAPQFADACPRDIINGQPFHYRRGANGSFVLYSVGWNEADDGGTISPAPNGGFSLQDGDWVWQ